MLASLQMGCSLWSGTPVFPACSFPDTNASVGAGSRLVWFVSLKLAAFPRIWWSRDEPVTSYLPLTKRPNCTNANKHVSKYTSVTRVPPLRNVQGKKKGNFALSPADHTQGAPGARGDSPPPGRGHTSEAELSGYLPFAQRHGAHQFLEQRF